MMECCCLHPGGGEWWRKSQYGMSSNPWNVITHGLSVQSCGHEVIIKLAADWMALPTNWVQGGRSRNEVSMEVATEKMALPTNWEFKVDETKSAWNYHPKEWNYTHPESPDKVSIKWTVDVMYYPPSGGTHGGWNEVNIDWAADVMEVATIWELKVIKMRLVSNEQQMEWHYPPTEGSKWS